MKISIQIPIIGLLLIALNSCYRDKGNYDYNEINEIEISNLKTSYTCMTGFDVLHIEPTITSTEENVPAERLAYYWIVAKGTTVIDTIGREAILNYAVVLPPDNYTLHLRVLDASTSVVYKTKTALSVGTRYSRGMLLMGEDDNGNADVDMISMVVDTVILKGILSQSGLPSLQGPINIMHTGGSASYMKLWVLTASGSYYLDRLSLQGSPANNFSKLVYTTDAIETDQLQPVVIAPQIRDAAGNIGGTASRAVLCNDGNIFTTYFVLNGGDFYPNPVNRDVTNMNVLLKAAPYLMYSIGSMGSMIWYDTENNRFMNYASFILNTSSVKLADATGDPFPWNQGATGRKLIYAENTRNTDGGSVNGNSFAIMQAPDNKRVIYKFYASGAATAKRDAYEVLPIATDFDKAEYYAFSSHRTVVFYSVGTKLYAYDYNKGNEKSYQFPEIGTDAITMLKFDTQIDHLTNSLYIATYNPTKKGMLKRYMLGTNPDKIEITPVEKAEFSGLVKIKNMSWRAVN